MSLNDIAEFYCVVHKLFKILCFFLVSMTWTTDVERMIKNCSVSEVKISIPILFLQKSLEDSDSDEDMQDLKILVGFHKIMDCLEICLSSISNIWQVTEYKWTRVKS